MDHSSSSLEKLSASFLPRERNCISFAVAFRQLMKENQWTQEELGQKIGLKRSTIANFLRLLSLPQPIQHSLVEGLITMGHAKALLSIEDPNKQKHLYQRILRKGLSVRQAEQAAGGITTEEDPDLYIKPLLEAVQHILGTKVTLEGDINQGRLCIDFYGMDDLDRLLNIFKGHYDHE